MVGSSWQLQGASASTVWLKISIYLYLYILVDLGVNLLTKGWMVTVTIKSALIMMCVVT
jgi:hypothetical protein